ncbi:MAG TPA: DUF6338 family protein [Acidobacteriaceae bacterium]|jgi:hypothetical protein
MSSLAVERERATTLVQSNNEGRGSGHGEPAFFQRRAASTAETARISPAQQTRAAGELRPAEAGSDSSATRSTQLLNTELAGPDPRYVAGSRRTFILLPGFLAAYILQSLVSRPKQSDLEKLIEALILSFVIYLISAVVLGTRFPVAWNLVKDSSGNFTYEIQLAWWKLLFLLLLPILLGFLCAFLMLHDYVLRILRWANLTDRTSRASTWNDVLQDVEGAAQVELGDGRNVMGWVSYYSDDPDDASLFLQHAAWVNTETNELEPITGPGILLTKEAGIRSVMFLDAPHSRSSDQG